MSVTPAARCRAYRRGDEADDADRGSQSRTRGAGPRQNATENRWSREHCRTLLVDERILPPPCLKPSDPVDHRVEVIEDAQPPDASQRHAVYHAMDLNLTLKPTSKAEGLRLFQTKQKVSRAAQSGPLGQEGCREEEAPASRAGRAGG